MCSDMLCGRITLCRLHRPLVVDDVVARVDIKAVTRLFSRREESGHARLIDTVLRKEVMFDCQTPSNPLGLRKGYGIEYGIGHTV